MKDILRRTLRSSALTRFQIHEEDCTAKGPSSGTALRLRGDCWRKGWRGVVDCHQRDPLRELLQRTRIELNVDAQMDVDPSCDHSGAEGLDLHLDGGQQMGQLRPQALSVFARRPLEQSYEWVVKDHHLDSQM